jgi:hypothetical protein
VDSTLRLTYSDVTATEWEALAARQVFFGHQSVGNNILDGVRDVLADHPEIRLDLIEARDLSEAGAGIYHARVGRNQSPLEKIADFAQSLQGGSTPAGRVGFLKFCYVDVEPETDADALFRSYRDSMARLRAAHPELTIVHFTMPLTRSENWKGVIAGRLRGRVLERDRNVVRHRYNSLLREAYAGREPVFDIAHMESTRPDGSREYFVREGGPVPSLVPEYTYDGGHLNEVGRRRVAEHLLFFLAKLPAR